MLLTATVQSTVASGAPSTVTLSNGAKVSFDGNFKTESGASYSGSVKVMMHHLDPSDPTTSDKMPGSLMAENSSGAQRVLETYGMLNIELQDAGGNKLQIVNPTSLEMPINAAQLATAPSTIPLWYFDETAGYWKEEGSATKVGTKYVGTVNHFSWWNCDMQFPTVNLSITVVNSNQIPMQGFAVEIVRPNQVFGTTGIINIYGQLSGVVPANETLTMKLYNINSICSNQVIYTQQIGPFSSNTTLPIVSLPPSSINTILVQGTLTNCNSANVTNGYAWLQTTGQFVYTLVTNGTFSFNVVVCSPGAINFSWAGLDFDTASATPIQYGTLSNQAIALGIIPVCETNTSPTGNLIDIDQNSYTYLTIGQQTWTQQNLKVSRYQDGTLIPQVTDPTAWANLTTGAWCYYNNDATTGATYGKLYNWYAVAGIYDAASLATPSLRKQLVPTGWHVPNKSEWTVLSSFLGGQTLAGGKMKETGTTHWLSPNSGATDSVGFTGLPGGWRNNTVGAFDLFGSNGYWWSSTESTSNTAYFCSLYYLSSNAGINSAVKNYGYSVRCVRD
jgi:uncharacterized protein (TIGR02145 family)